MLEDFLDALQNFRRKRLRTFLSLLGIIIGVASVIVIMSMGQASTQKIKDSFGSAGLDMVSLSGGFFRRSRAAVTIRFDEPFREKLFDSVTGIKKIWYKGKQCQRFLRGGGNRLHAFLRHSAGTREIF